MRGMKRTLKAIATTAAIMITSLSAVFAQDTTTAPPTTGLQQSATTLVSPYLLPEVFDRTSAAFQSGDYTATILNASLDLLFNPTHDRAYLLRGLGYLNTNETDRARADIDAAIAVTAPDDTVFLGQLYSLRGQMKADQGDVEAALADYTTAIEINPSADAYFSRAQLSMSEQHPQDALDDLNRAIELTSTDGVYYLLRAYANADLNHVSESAADYADYLRLVEQTRTDADAIQPGTPIFVDVAYGTTTAVPFDGQAGQVLTALVIGRQGEQTDPILVLLDPSGTPLIGDDNGSGGTAPLILDYVLPDSGTYTLLIGSTPVQATGQAAAGIELLGP
ncbi:MAG: hypothetical protein U0670_17280 [Anaerolineae bacterium]